VRNHLAARLSALGALVRAVTGRWRTLTANALGAARSCLRRETWTIENLRALWLAVRRRPGRTAAALAAACAMGAGLLGVVWILTPPEGVALAEAREGPFVVAVVESGTLQALRSVTYASTIQSNQAKIVALAPEGKLVQKGDLLILFDAAPFEEEIRKNQALPRPIYRRHTKTKSCRSSRTPRPWRARARSSSRHSSSCATCARARAA
jgi:glucose/arabinose dehydrogenase